MKNLHFWTQPGIAWMWGGIFVLLWDWCWLRTIWLLDGPNGQLAQFAFGNYPLAENEIMITVFAVLGFLSGAMQAWMASMGRWFADKQKISLARVWWLGWGSLGTVAGLHVISSTTPGKCCGSGVYQTAPIDPITLGTALLCFALALATLLAGMLVRTGKSGEPSGFLE